MTRRRKTDGERIADRVFSGRYQGMAIPSELAAEIDRLIRKRMMDAWDEGWWSGRACDLENPYQGRRKK